jgi:hypothetical protein
MGCVAFLSVVLLLDSICCWNFSLAEFALLDKKRLPMNWPVGLSDHKPVRPMNLQTSRFNRWTHESAGLADEPMNRLVWSMNPQTDKFDWWTHESGFQQLSPWIGWSDQRTHEVRFFGTVIQFGWSCFLDTLLTIIIRIKHNI